MYRAHWASVQLDGNVYAVGASATLMDSSFGVRVLHDDHVSQVNYQFFLVGTPKGI